jgi:hypothetical protein
MVTLVAEVGGRTRSVHVTLAGQDHQWAIEAYSMKVPLTVSGDLVFERRAWRLTGDVQVDPSFLRYLSAVQGESASRDPDLPVD